MIVVGDDIRVLVDGEPIEYDQSVQFDSDKIHVKKLVVEPFNEWTDKVGNEFNISIDNGGPIGTYILKRATFRAEVNAAALCFLTFEKKQTN